jgi:hypothetical protein
VTSSLLAVQATELPLTLRSSLFGVGVRHHAAAVAVLANPGTINSTTALQALAIVTNGATRALTFVSCALTPDEPLLWCDVLLCD